MNILGSIITLIAEAIIIAKVDNISLVGWIFLIIFAILAILSLIEERPDDGSGWEDDVGQ